MATVQIRGLDIPRSRYRPCPKAADVIDEQLIHAFVLFQFSAYLDQITALKMSNEQCGIWGKS